MIVEVECRMCGKTHYLKVEAQDFNDWNNGKLAQDAFPYLTLEKRELLISRTCPQCWKKLFGGEDG